MRERERRGLFDFNGFIWITKFPPAPHFAIEATAAVKVAHQVYYSGRFERWEKKRIYPEILRLNNCPRRRVVEVLIKRYYIRELRLHLGLDYTRLLSISPTKAEFIKCIYLYMTVICTILFIIYSYNNSFSKRNTSIFRFSNFSGTSRESWKKKVVHEREREMDVRVDLSRIGLFHCARYTVSTRLG